MERKSKILKLLERIKNNINIIESKIHPDETWNAGDLPQKDIHNGTVLSFEYNSNRDGTDNNIPDFSWSKIDIPRSGEIVHDDENTNNTGHLFCELDSPDLNWQWEDLPTGECIITQEPSEIHPHDSFGDFIEFKGSEAENPWKYYSISEGKFSYYYWSLALNISINLEDAYTKQKAKSYAHWLLDFLGGKINIRTYKCIMEICEEGITLEELKSVLLVRDIWSEIFPTSALPSYKWLLKLVRVRGDYPVEYIIDPSWVDEWRSYRSKHLSSRYYDNVYELSVLKGFIEFKINENENIDIVDNVMQEITEYSYKEVVPLYKNLSELKIYDNRFNPRNTAAFLRSHWDWPYVSLHDIIEGVELPFYEWGNKKGLHEE